MKRDLLITLLAFYFKKIVNSPYSLNLVNWVFLTPDRMPSASNWVATLVALPAVRQMYRRAAPKGASHLKG